MVFVNPWVGYVSVIVAAVLLAVFLDWLFHQWDIARGLDADHRPCKHRFPDGARCGRLRHAESTPHQRPRAGQR